VYQYDHAPIHQLSSAAMDATARARDAYIQVVRPAGRFRETAIKLNDIYTQHSKARFWSFDIFKQNRPMTCYEKKYKN
jgi:hypothetical protein